jgi:hypothetical protein
MVRLLIEHQFMDEKSVSEFTVNDMDLDKMNSCGNIGFHEEILPAT